MIGVYCEDFRDGRAFAEAARTAGKPVVLLTVGRTAAGSPRRALAHRLADERPRSGRGRVPRRGHPSRRHAARARRRWRRRCSRRTGRAGRGSPSIGDGGGYGAIASDLLGSRGLELPVLSEATQATLRASLPPTAATANPVDLAGAGEQDTFSFVRVRPARSSRQTTLDAVLFTAYFGGYSTLSDELRDRELAVAELLADAAAESGKPLVVHTMYWDSPPARALRAAARPGVPRDRVGGRRGRGAHRGRSARPAGTAAPFPLRRRR